MGTTSGSSEEIIPAGLAADAEAERVRRRLVTEADERHSPRTTATVGQLLDRFELLELESNTLATSPARTSGS